MWFINNISKSKITSLVLLSLTFFLFLITNWQGLIVPIHGALLLGAAEINSNNKSNKTFLSYLLVFCRSFLHSLTYDFTLLQVGLEASGISLPPTYFLPLCPSSPHFSTKGESGWSFFLFWMLIIQVLYKENLGTGIPISITPEMQRVKHNQENLSSVFWKEREKKMPLNLIII